MRAVKGSTFTLTSPTFVAADNETPTDCGSTPTCTVTREDGTALAALTVTDAGVGVYTAPLTTTHTSRVDRLQVTWTGTVGSFTQVFRQEVEVVGGRYVTVPALREMPGMDDETVYPTAHLLEELDAVEALVEDWCQVAFVRRYARDEFEGRDNDRWTLRNRPVRAVLAVTVDGVSQTTSEFDLHEPTGEIIWNDSTFDAPDGTGVNVSVAYEYGYDAPPPDLATEVKRYVVDRVQRRLVDAPTNAISETQDGRTIRFSTANPRMGRATGHIDLDAVLQRYAERIPGVG